MDQADSTQHEKNKTQTPKQNRPVQRVEPLDVTPWRRQRFGSPSAHHPDGKKPNASTSAAITLVTSFCVGTLERLLFGKPLS